MARHDFSGNGLRTRRRVEEDADPRVGLVNLADVMLVFACGLMLALVSYWSLDVQDMLTAELGEERVEVDATPDELGMDGGEGYLDMGRVYMDPDTGKLYILEDGGNTIEIPDGALADQTPSED